MSSSTPEEKKGNSSTGDTDTSLEQKVEMAQKFDKEMKDYAKATVKEFLGIYGYEEDVDNISMEDSCSETPRCSATPNINNPISTSSETLATGTQSTSSDFSNNKQQDTKEDLPSKEDVIAYHSSGPIVFAVVSAESPELNLDLDQTEDIVSVCGTPVSSSRDHQLKAMQAHCYQLAESPSPPFESQATTLKPLPPMPTKMLALSGRVDTSSESVVMTSEFDKTSSEASGKLNVVSDLSESAVGMSEHDGVMSVVGGAASDVVGNTSEMVETSSGREGNVSTVQDPLLGTPNHSPPLQIGQYLIDTQSAGITDLSRKERNRLYKQTSRLREPTEKKEARLTRQREQARARRADEGQTERGARLIRDRDRQRRKRSHEPEDERQKRLIKQRLSARTRRQSEPPEKKQARLLRDKERSRKNRAAKKVQPASMVVTSQG